MNLETEYKENKEIKINELIESLIKEDYLEDIIDNFKNELKKHETQREIINELKIKKDKYIKQYIEDTKFPEKLELEYLNYKALLFYFLETFTYKNMTLDFSLYNNNLNRIQKSLKTTFEEIFKNEMPIKINVNLKNFPHLIGYKDYHVEDGKKIFSKTTKDEFIKNIFYESNLTHDYELDGCDINKIQAFSWIQKTLYKPLYVFTKESLKLSNLKTDMIFVRRKNSNYHYVSLKKHLGNIENEYYINSHHHITQDEFNEKFNLNKRIYEFKFPKKEQ
ncbi:hypothetical protein LPB137_10915 [Poseidonibacter parvus]|uniref:Phage-Barnase-EndoU-ColicinE5/D-RelE like nuclease 4 domain-containing protein n=1 Tax=Poseidonibacter parvus TaxID=1850254 RepID=A0A1P8KP88_9BACT|nr:hypothetical protein [Poseidonibacter parvus]APW66321.1 hypothetical protein LPB137_10915 [Poseidonibacter parvus]